MIMILLELLTIYTIKHLKSAFLIPLLQKHKYKMYQKCINFEYKIKKSP